MTELEKRMAENPEVAKAYRHAMDLSNLMIIAPHKAETEEKDLNPQMPDIISFIRRECVRQKQISDEALDDHNHDYTELNKAFRKLL